MISKVLLGLALLALIFLVICLFDTIRLSFDIERKKDESNNISRKSRKR